MLYKNMEIHNIETMTEGEVGHGWSRFPLDVCDKMERESGQKNCKNGTGVEFRFIIKGDKVALRMRALDGGASNCFHVYRGGIQGTWQDHQVDKFVGTEVRDYVIEKSDNPEYLQRVSREMQTEWNPEVVRVIFDRGSFELVDVIGEIEPPRKEDLPQKTILFYGSSITHGSNSIDTSHSWASVVAYHLGMDCLNKGQAGSCMMEPSVVEYLAQKGVDHQWDIAVLELGINVISWERSRIRERVTYTLEQVAGKNPDKPVFLISPLYSADDFNQVGKADRWREEMAAITKELAYPNVTYIDGRELIGDITGISADEVHPNIYGIWQTSERLTKIIKETLSKAE